MGQQNNVQECFLDRFMPCDNVGGEFYKDYTLPDFILLSDNRTMIVYAEQPASIAIFDIKEGKLVHNLKQTSLKYRFQSIGHIFVSNNEKFLVCHKKLGSPKYWGLITVYDIKSGELIYELFKEDGTTGHKEYAQHVILTKDDKVLISSSSYLSELNFWDMNTGKLITEYGYDEWNQDQMI